MAYYATKVLKLIAEEEVPRTRNGIFVISAPLLRAIFNQPGNIGGPVIKELVSLGFDCHRQASLTRKTVIFNEDSLYSEDEFFGNDYVTAVGGYCILPMKTKAMFVDRPIPSSILAWPKHIIEAAVSLYGPQLKLLGYESLSSLPHSATNVTAVP